MTAGKIRLDNLQALPIRRQLIGLALTGILTAVIYKFAVIDPRKRTYERFYKTYNAEEHEAQMEAAGLFESAGLKE